LSKTTAGNFFEDFRLGQEFVHAPPRTMGAGDQALYLALYGSRFALQSADDFARRLGFKQAPLDDLLVFHAVFGRTVSDISLNAVANLGYGECRWLKSVYPGDTLRATSTVVGLKENSNRKSGIVYVRSQGRDGAGDPVLEFARWVMVRKRNADAPAPPVVLPDIAPKVAASALAVPAGLDFRRYDFAAAGSAHAWDDYAAGERMDHVDGVTIEEAEHQLATRLYQNAARVHFNQHAAAHVGEGRRLVYGGHVISIARALSFNGLGNACLLAAINGGRHANPVAAGDTVYAWSEVLEKAPLPGRGDAGALRLRTLAVKNQTCGEFPGPNAAGTYPPNVVLDLDYWTLMPRRTPG
jgi:2-methylfumaryl-CoA hydratase